MPAIFLVEDDALIRMMVADMVIELGHTVAAEAGDLQRGLQFAAEAYFDLAILDLKLSDGRSDPIADVLARRKIPFAFASGYASDVVPERFIERPVLLKPFRLEQLKGCIEAMLR